MENKEKRYLTKIGLYVYAKTDAEAKSQAQNICNNINNQDDAKAGVLEMHEAPFGQIGKFRKVESC